jgi:hypothetical protein
MIPQDVKAFVDTHLGAPGTCTVMAIDLTITLPTWTDWPEKVSITVKDGTGVNPNCMIVAAGNGLIDGKPSVHLNQEHESMTFEPDKGGNTWTIA